MTGSWTILNSRTFDRKISEYARQSEHYCNPTASFDDAEDFVKKFRALQRFDKDSADLRKRCADPTTILKYYAQDSSGNLYYTLKISGWIGYYYLSFPGKLGVGLFIAHESDVPTDILDILAEALKDFNSDK